jgi:pimeloyl-ACP methyl ester carboxylesterase
VKIKFAVALFVFASLSASSADSQSPGTQVETGTLDGAAYRIDVPANWNHILLIYYHGYSERPIVFDKSKPDDVGSALAGAGFAVAQSAFSATGWAVDKALPQTESLRKYTISHYGQPKETYVLGHSMGGLLTVATIERNPERYDGALPLCGLLEPTTWAIERAGSTRAAFDYYFPGILPGPLGAPASFQFDDAAVNKVLNALRSNPKGKAELMALTQFKTVRDLADGLVFGGFVLRDIEQKTGASALENHNFIYAGGADDNALNDGVKRYTASEKAIEFLKTWYTPTGILTKPVLAVHTTYDPIIPAESVSVYADLVLRTGSGSNFVQQYVRSDGHCHISGPETLTALDELIQWKHTGKKPKSGAVPVAPNE